MSNIDDQRLRGSPQVFEDDRGGAVLYPHPIIGIVKDNIDSLRSGTIQVFLKRLNGADENNIDNWTKVHYSSPFFGYTPNTGSPNEDGTYVGNRNSYGFWATPPDIGTEVICIFINGQPDLGYYVASIPPKTLTHMVPAVGASPNVIPNDGEAESYGGAKKLPVTEYNDASNKQSNDPAPADLARPVHSYQAAILNKQGLIRDADRGAISSSSMRESPSNVFGLSTPGRPIYQGGYDSTTIKAAISDTNTPDEKFKIVGRLGGHTLVMDDGDLEGRDQLLRLRTSTGHMILMNDYAQTLFIIHANGQSYIELGKEGTIDMFSTNSVNVRTQGDLNLHADNNVNIKAMNSLNMSAKSVNIESLEDTNQFVGTTFKQFTKGDNTVKVNGKLSFDSAGDASLKSGGTTYVNGGPNVHLNTGSSSLVPEEVKQISIVAHTDTLYDDKKGYAPAPGKLTSIVSRAPAHSPWASACQGVDVKVDAGASANLPPEPSQDLQQVNASANTVPVNPTTPALAATVPNVPAASSSVDQVATSSLVSQMAVNAQQGPMTPVTSQNTAGVVDSQGIKMGVVGGLGLNPSQYAQAGILKPGSDVAINAAISRGMSIEKAMPPNVFTGKDGVNNLSDLATNVPAQTNAATNLLSQSQTALTNSGVITGKESVTQSGGLILSGATAGVKPTLEMVNNSTSKKPDLSKLANTANSLSASSGNQQGSALLKTGLALSASLSKNNLSDPKTALASGNAAANQADKAGGSLGGVNVGDNLKGAVAGAFAKITAAFPKLSGKKPQSLTVANEKKATEEESKNTTPAEDQTTNKQASSPAGLNDVENIDKQLQNAFGVQQGGSLRNSLETTGKSVGSSTDKLGLTGAGNISEQVQKGQISPQQGIDKVNNIFNSMTDNPGVPGVPGIPGGMSAISGLVKAGESVKLPGTDSIGTDVKNIASGVQSGEATKQLGDVKNQIDKKGGINALASTGLNPADAAQLQGAISSMGSPGSVEVKAPTVAADTFNFSAILGQSKNLLGDSKIPNLDFGAIKIPSQPLSAEQVKEYDKYKAELAVQEDAKWDKRKKYYDLKQAQTQGKATQQEVDAAENDYKECLQKIEDLRKKMAFIAQGGASA